jgi:L-serine dehydratase
VGPIVAAGDFLNRIRKYFAEHHYQPNIHIRCILKGSLAFTGKGHTTDHAVALGLHGYSAKTLADQHVSVLIKNIRDKQSIELSDNETIMFSPATDIVFDQGGIASGTSECHDF